MAIEFIIHVATGPGLKAQTEGVLSILVIGLGQKVVMAEEFHEAQMDPGLKTEMEEL